MKKVFLILALLTLSATAFAQSFSAGAAKIKITPVVEPWEDLNNNGLRDENEAFTDLNGNGVWDPVWLAGYIGNRSAIGVYDDLWAEALVISDDKKTVLLISLDFIGFLFDQIDLIKAEIAAQYNIPKENIWICSTHTHSGPDTIGLWGDRGKSGLDKNYLERVRRAVVECAGQAIAQKTPAVLRLAQEHFVGDIEDCRPPDVKNDRLLVLQLQNSSGTTIATVVNYAMHAEVMNYENRLVTADYPGVLRRELEERFGGIALFFAADIGGMQSPRTFFHTFWNMRAVGRKLAKASIRALEGEKFFSHAELDVRADKTLFEVSNPKFVGMIEAGLFGDAANLAEKKDGKLFLPSDLGWIKLGSAEFLCVPGEAFPEVGNVLRAQLQNGRGAEFPFVLGLCNNEFGYIVPADQWKDDGYEEGMSLGKPTAQHLAEKLKSLSTAHPQ